MRKFILLLAVLFIFFNAGSTSFPSDKTKTVVTSRVASENPLLLISTAKIKEVEKLLGRKMKLKEKIGFKIYQYKLRKELSLQKDNENETNKGKTAMILGIIGIACLLLPYVAIASIPLAILAIIFGNQAKKQNPRDGKAIAGVVLGWVTLGLIALALILVAIILSSWGWGWG